MAPNLLKDLQQHAVDLRSRCQARDDQGVTLGNLIVNMRATRGMTRAEMQRVAGISQTGLIAIESGRTSMPRRDTLESLLVCLARASALTDQEIADLHEVTGLRLEILAKVNVYAGSERVKWTPARNPMLEDLTEAVNNALTVIPVETLISLLNTMAEGMASNPTSLHNPDAPPPPRINVVHGAGVQSDPSTRKARKARPAD